MSVVHCSSGLCLLIYFICDLHYPQLMLLLRITEGKDVTMIKAPPKEETDHVQQVWMYFWRQLHCLTHDPKLREVKVEIFR